MTEPLIGRSCRRKVRGDASDGGISDSLGDDRDQ